MKLSVLAALPILLLANAAAQNNAISYMPRVDGVVKAKVEMSTYDGNYRFSVRNARFGLSGNVARDINYRFQTDISSEGNISLLDANVGYVTPRLNIRIGQQAYNFSTDLICSPASNIFSNRSLLAKFLTSYYGSYLKDGQTRYFTSTMGGRDLGITAGYTFPGRTPLTLSLGILSGNGMNNPQWDATANLVGRIDVKPTASTRLSASYYNGRTPIHDMVVTDDAGTPQVQRLRQKITMAGAEAGYDDGHLTIQAEYARRYLKNDGGKAQVLAAAFGYATYRFDIPDKYIARYWAPVLRWDTGNNIDYVYGPDARLAAFSADRITAGLRLGFAEKIVRAELRLSYEKYLLRRGPEGMAHDRLLQDKVTLEFVASF